MGDALHQGRVHAVHRPGRGQRQNGLALVERFVGEGAMGEVYLGEHLDLRRPAVIKLIKARFINEGQVVARMRRDPLARAMRPDKATMAGVACSESSIPNFPSLRIRTCASPTSVTNLDDYWGFQIDGLNIELGGFIFAEFEEPSAEAFGSIMGLSIDSANYEPTFDRALELGADRIRVNAILPGATVPWLTRKLGLENIVPPAPRAPGGMRLTRASR